MKRRSLLQAGLLAPLVARAQTPCPAELTAIDGDPVPPGPECVNTDGWPAQRPGYIPVVPNLAGYGCDTLAGYGVNRRGDNVQVLYVTSLAISGTGSFNEVVNRDIGGAARVIVFNVEGYLGNSWTGVPTGKPHVTVAGQTAPGKGVCFRGASFYVRSDHVLVQHLHSRPGDASVPGPQTWSLRSGFMAYSASNIVFDHCSSQWSPDEGLAAYAASSDVTFAHCIAMQNLDPGTSGGPKCFLIGGGSSGNPNRISVVGCLLGHFVQRAPLIRCPALVFVNNVLYNWGGFGIVGDLQSYEGRTGQDLDLVTVIGNNYKAGPNTGSSRPWRIRGDGDTWACNVNSKLYLEDNRWNGTVTSPQSNMIAFGSGRSAAQNYLTAPDAYPVWSDGIVPIASDKAYDLVLKGVGARSANRDSLDARCVADVTNRTSSGFGPTSIPSAYPTYGSAVFDHRVSHNYPSGFDPIPDGQSGRPAPGTINPGTGRTVIEEWCNRRAAEVEAV